MNAKVQPNNCRISCVRFILERFGVGQSGGNLDNAIDTVSTIQLFLTAGLSVRIFLPRASWIFPFSWRILLRYRGLVDFDHQTFSAFSSSFGNQAFLYHLTAAQVCGRREFWTHCVCEVLDQRGRVYYDNLRVIGDGYQTVRVPTHAELQEMWGIIIFVGFGNIK